MKDDYIVRIMAKLFTSTYSESELDSNVQSWVDYHDVEVIRDERDMELYDEDVIYTSIVYYVSAD